MGKIEKKIIELLNAVYKLPDGEEEIISWYVVQIPEEEKRKILMAVVKRYQAFQSNAKKLEKGLQKVSNDLDEIKEHNDADKVLADL